MHILRAGSTNCRQGECCESMWMRKSRFVLLPFNCCAILDPFFKRKITYPSIYHSQQSSFFVHDALRLKKSCWLRVVGYCCHLETGRLMNYQIRHCGAKVQPATFPSFTHWHSSKQGSGTLGMAGFFPFLNTFFSYLAQQFILFKGQSFSSSSPDC